MSKLSLLVSVGEEHRQRIREVARGLESAGMKVEQLMEAIGTIAGSCDSERLAAVHRVRGVAYVEQERSFQLSPPDSDIQ
ncbi:MAG: ketohydroxyglutarate aldolase [Oscillatoria sp. SIO1A7]|nr:ketohydroxyglutarate aldolase [Oscillatoria sp. SIO1A7]